MSHFTCDWYSELHEHVLQRYRLGNLPHALLIQGEDVNYLKLARIQT